MGSQTERSKRTAAIAHVHANSVSELRVETDLRRQGTHGAEKESSDLGAPSRDRSRPSNEGVAVLEEMHVVGRVRIRATVGEPWKLDRRVVWDNPRADRLQMTAVARVASGMAQQTSVGTRGGARRSRDRRWGGIAARAMPDRAAACPAPPRGKSAFAGKRGTSRVKRPSMAVNLRCGTGPTQSVPRKTADPAQCHRGHRCCSTRGNGHGMHRSVRIPGNGQAVGVHRESAVGPLVARVIAMCDH